MVYGIDSALRHARLSESRRAAVGKSELVEWEVREDRTNRVLGTYSFAKRPVRGDVVELDGERFGMNLGAVCLRPSTQRKRPASHSGAWPPRLAATVSTGAACSAAKAPTD